MPSALGVQFSEVSDVLFLVQTLLQLLDLRLNLLTKFTLHLLHHLTTNSIALHDIACAYLHAPSYIIFKSGYHSDSS